jgi:hypothetical protein
MCSVCSTCSICPSISSISRFWFNFDQRLTEKCDNSTEMNGSIENTIEIWIVKSLWNWILNKEKSKTEKDEIQINAILIHDLEMIPSTTARKIEMPFDVSISRTVNHLHHSPAIKFCHLRESHTRRFIEQEALQKDWQNVDCLGLFILPIHQIGHYLTPYDCEIWRKNRQDQETGRQTNSKMRSSGPQTPFGTWFWQMPLPVEEGDWRSTSRSKMSTLSKDSANLQKDWSFVQGKEVSLDIEWISGNGQIENP